MFVRHWWCRKCQDSTDWKPNFNVMYRWKSQFILQYKCCECHTKRDLTFDGWSFDRRMKAHGVPCVKEDLEFRKEVDYHKGD